MVVIATVVTFSGDGDAKDSLAFDYDDDGDE